MKEEDYVLSSAAVANDDAMVINLEDAPPTAVNENGFKKKKRSKSFSLLKAALNIFQEKPNDKEEIKKPMKKKNSDWKTVVGSMRPLTLQDKSPTPSLPSMSPSCSFDSLPLDGVVPDSPVLSTASSRSGGTMSQYASAPNLQELDTGSDRDEVFDATAGDEMIDVKAEEFIAQFYQQIKLQARQEF